VPLNFASVDERNSFYKSLEFVLKWEGGYVNDPDDPGGETKWGISKRYHPDEDIRGLSPERAAEIYYEDYWIVAACDLLPLPLSTVMFDSAVSCGPARAVSWLERSRGDPFQYIALRREFYHERAQSKPSMRKFLRGWNNRLNDLESFCQTYVWE